jgi:hypothetical protein
MEGILYKPQALSLSLRLNIYHFIRHLRSETTLFTSHLAGSRVRRSIACLRKQFCLYKRLIAEVSLFDSDLLWQLFYIHHR